MDEARQLAFQHGRTQELTVAAQLDRLRAQEVVHTGYVNIFHGKSLGPGIPNKPGSATCPQYIILKTNHEKQRKIYSI